MIKKETRSRFSCFARMIFSALLLAFALGSVACSSSSGSGTSSSVTGTTGVTGSAQ